MPNDHDRAWNNFVLNGDYSAPDIDDDKRDAAIANRFMAGANSGGLNSFLTATPELSGQEVLDALSRVGATTAAEQLHAVLACLGEPLGPSSAEVRWATLERLWTEDADLLDVLSEDADAELLHALARHVDERIDYYLVLDGRGPNAR